MNKLFEDYVTALEAVTDAAANLLDDRNNPYRVRELAAAVAECEAARRAESEQYD